MVLVNTWILVSAVFRWLISNLSAIYDGYKYGILKIFKYLLNALKNWFWKVFWNKTISPWIKSSHFIFFLNVKEKWNLLDFMSKCYWIGVPNTQSDTATSFHHRMGTISGYTFKTNFQQPADLKCKTREIWKK